MKNTIRYIFLAVVLFSSSCSEEFLEPNPKSFFAPENVFVDKTGFDALLVSMRKILVSEVSSYTHFISHQVAASELGAPLLQFDFYYLTPSSDRYQLFVNQI